MVVHSKLKHSLLIKKPTFCITRWNFVYSKDMQTLLIVPNKYQQTEITIPRSVKDIIGNHQ